MISLNFPHSVLPCSHGGFSGTLAPELVTIWYFFGHSFILLLCSGYFEYKTLMYQVGRNFPTDTEFLLEAIWQIAVLEKNYQLRKPFYMFPCRRRVLYWQRLVSPIFTPTSPQRIKRSNQFTDRLDKNVLFSRSRTVALLPRAEFFFQTSSKEIRNFFSVSTLKLFYFCRLSSQIKMRVTICRFLICIWTVSGKKSEKWLVINS